MAGADEAKGTSVLTDWEGTVDAAIRIHECIYHRLQGLQGAGAGLGSDRGDGRQGPRWGTVGRAHNLAGITRFSKVSSLS
jgi:hypothetical protein